MMGNHSHYSSWDKSINTSSEMLMFHEAQKTIVDNFCDQAHGDDSQSTIAMCEKKTS